MLCSSTPPSPSAGPEDEAVPENTPSDVLVIGGGPGGTSAALTAARLGARVTLVEASRIGGTCLNTGCVPTRVFARTARLLRDAELARRIGVVDTVRRIDWPALVGRVRDTVERVREVKYPAGLFADAGVELVIDGAARFVDATTVELESGRRLSASTIIVAVGGHSRVLPIPGIEHTVVPEHVLDVPELPTRVAIVGAGNTGAQLATVFSSLGSEVTLLDAAPRILPASDASISAAVQAAFERHGIAVHPAIDGVDRFERGENGTTVHFRLGGEERSATADLVVMATGWPANLEHLDPQAAGLELNRGWLAADAQGRTNQPHIFVVGDADGTDMLVQIAEEEGEATATLAVTGREHDRSRLVPAGGFTDPDYAGVGPTSADLDAQGIRHRTVTVPYDRLDRAVLDDRAEGFLTLVADESAERVLGAHVVGENAADVVHLVVTAMSGGMTVADLSRVPYAYPTYSAIVRQAARRMLGERHDGELSS